MYSSIIKTKTRPGDWLAILGAGGGLGHMYALLTVAILSHCRLSIAQGSPNCSQKRAEGGCN